MPEEKFLINIEHTFYFDVTLPSHISKHVSMTTFNGNAVYPIYCETLKLVFCCRPNIMFIIISTSHFHIRVFHLILTRLSVFAVTVQTSQNHWCERALYVRGGGGVRRHGPCIHMPLFFFSQLITFPTSDNQNHRKKKTFIFT